MLGLDAEGREVKTIEGMAEGARFIPCRTRLLILARRSAVIVRRGFCWLRKS